MKAKKLFFDSEKQLFSLIYSDLGIYVESILATLKSSSSTSL
jgi:hypothetical protein